MLKYPTEKLSMTNEQIKLIHVAARQVDLIDSTGNARRYKLMLLNVGGVETSKDLTNETFEDCMALMEEMGFSWERGRAMERASFSGSGGSPARVQSTYWRDKVRHRGEFCSARMVHKIGAMIKEIGRYPLESMVLRMSNHRTDKVNLLTPREAWNLIEALKAIVDRAGPPKPADMQRSTLNAQRSTPNEEQPPAAAKAARPIETILTAEELAHCEEEVPF